MVPPPPFELSPLPQGFAVTDASVGQGEPEFSSDSFGGVHPTVYLVPTDWSGVDDHRWIEVSSIDGSGNQGGIYQELPTYPNPDDQRGHFEIDGHPAIKIGIETDPNDLDEGGNATSTAAYVAVNTSVNSDSPEALDGGTRQGILVTGPVDDLSLMERLAAAAVVDEGRNPHLNEVPEGWKILGRLNGAQAEGPTEFGPESPVGRRALNLVTTDQLTLQLHVLAIAGDPSIAVLKALEAMWSPYDNTDFAPVEPAQVNGTDAFINPCCRDRAAVAHAPAVAWFTVEDVVFQVRGPEALIGAPNTLQTFADAVGLTDESVWAELAPAATAPNGSSAGTAHPTPVPPTSAGG